jgi:hypothetical protein
MDITEINNPLDIARFCESPNWSPTLCVDWETGTVDIESRHESQNTVSFHEWHGHSSSWGIPLVDAEQVRDRIEECLPSIKAASEQYYSDWDGNNNVARFHDEEEIEAERLAGGCDPMVEQVDAYEQSARGAAVAKIEQALAGLEHAGSAWFWDAGDWFQYASDVAGEYSIGPLTTDEELDAIAERMVESSAEHGDYNVILESSDCRDYAEQVRDGLLEDEDVLEDLWDGLPGPTLSRVDDAGDTIELRRAADDIWLTLDTSNDAVEVVYDTDNGIDGETDWVVARLGPYTRTFQGAAL